MERTPETKLVLTLGTQTETLTAQPSLLHLKSYLPKVFNECKFTSAYSLLHNNQAISALEYEQLVKSFSTLELTVKLPDLPEPSVVTCIATDYLMFWELSTQQMKPIHNTSVNWNAVPIIAKNYTHVIGGDQHWQLDFQNFAFREKPPMKVPRYSFGCCYTKDCIYIAGGVDVEGYSDYCEEYNTLTDEWNYINCLPGGGRSGLSLAGWGNLKLFGFGGFNGVDYFNTVLEYDLDSGLWKELALRLPCPNYWMGNQETGEGVLLFGGRATNEVYLLNVANLTLKKKGNLPGVLKCTRFVQPSIKLSQEIVCITHEMDVVKYDPLNNQWVFELQLPNL